MKQQIHLENILISTTIYNNLNIYNYIQQDEKNTAISHTAYSTAGAAVVASRLQTEEEGLG